MKVLILPGYSKSNLEWAHEIKKYLEKNSNNKTIVHEWRHWKEDENFSNKFEISKILKIFSSEEDICVIAKSIGTRVFVEMLPIVGEKVSKLVLCGIPVDGKMKRECDLYAKGLSCIDTKKVIVMQNEGDPLASYDEVNGFIQKINNIKVLSMPRSDHFYPYYEEFLNFLEN